MTLLKEIQKTIDPNDWVNFDRSNFQSFNGDDIERVSGNLEIIVLSLLEKFSKYLLNYKTSVDGIHYFDNLGNIYTSSEIQKLF